MSRKKTIDALDIKIMDIMQKEPNITNTEIAKRVGLSNAAVMVRVNNLVKRGIIEIVAVVNLGWLKYTYQTMVEVQVPEQYAKDFQERVLKLTGLVILTRLNREVPATETVYKTLLLNFVNNTEQDFINEFKPVIEDIDYNVFYHVYQVEDRIRKLPTLVWEEDLR